MVTQRPYDPQSLKPLRSRPLAKARRPCSAPWSGPSLCGGLGAELRLSSQVCVDTRSHACSKSRVAMSCLRGCPPGSWPHCCLDHFPSRCWLPPCVPTDPLPPWTHLGRPSPHILHLLCAICGRTDLSVPWARGAGDTACMNAGLAFGVGRPWRRI